MKEFPNTIHNQTDPEFIARVSVAHAQEQEKLGTAVYFIPDPATGANAVQSVLVENSPYQQCEERGQYCVAFKWISHETASYAEILKHKTERNCTQDFCPSPRCGPSGAICACVGGNCYI